MDQVFLPYTFLKSEISMKILLTFLTIALFSWNKSWSNDTPVGKKGDMILEQYSSTSNKWEEVILIFGFGDDYTNCQIIQKAFQRLGKRKYRYTKIR